MSIVGDIVVGVMEFVIGMFTDILTESLSRKQKWWLVAGIGVCCLTFVFSMIILKLPWLAWVSGIFGLVTLIAFAITSLKGK